MGFQDAVKSCFAQFATFQGRARRAEFWYFVLFTILGGMVAGVLDAIVFGSTGDETGPLGGIFGLVVLIPSIAVAVRRLHDTGRSGWWWWLWLIPIVGWIIAIVFYATRSQPGENEYGYDPLEQPLDEPPAPGGSARKQHWSDRIDESEFTRTNIPDVPRD